MNRWTMLGLAIALSLAGCESSPRAGEDPLGTAEATGVRYDRSTGEYAPADGQSRRLRSTMNGYRRDDTVTRDAEGRVTSAGVGVTVGK